MNFIIFDGKEVHSQITIFIKEQNAGLGTSGIISKSHWFYISLKKLKSDGVGTYCYTITSGN